MSNIKKILTNIDEYYNSPNLNTFFIFSKKSFVSTPLVRQLVGQNDKTSTKEKLPACCASNALRRADCKPTTSFTAARATYALALSERTNSGPITVACSFPDGEVSVFWPGMVVGPS